MEYKNTAEISGKLIRQPKLYTTKNGYNVCDFMLKVDRTGREGYDNIPCTAWRELAEKICLNGQQGQPVWVKGHLEVSKYEHKSPDYIEWKTKLTAEALELMPMEESAFDSMGEKDGNIPF